jgi:hypothetical protein
MNIIAPSTRTYTKLLYLKWLTMAEVFGNFLHGHPANSCVGVDMAYKSL